MLKRRVNTSWLCQLESAGIENVTSRDAERRENSNLLLMGQMSTESPATAIFWFEAERRLPWRSLRMLMVFS